MNELQWVEDIFEKIIKKSEIVASRNRENIPYTTVEGRFDDMGKSNFCWWTNGFWGGMMWQLYHATNNDLYREIAENNEKLLDKNLMEAQGLDHDNGFKWLPTSIANYRLTGNLSSKNRGILAANNMAGRFNPAGSFIRAWNDWGESKNTGLAIIDCMMNLPLLYWASKETSDPRFKQIAVLHADTAEKYFIRPDGSVNHIVEFNPETGEYVKSYGGQGYAEGSSWTRGQAWALYGFVLSYIHTQKEEYLNAALRVANYFITNIPDDGLIPVDFRQPKDCTYEDSTAAAIAACGLLEISKQVKEADHEIYEKAAIKLIKALDEKSCNWDEKVDNILEKCTAAFHDKNHEFSIIYGDYFFIEAIWKLTSKELFIW
ncbi:glycosyl hydrolase family 88 [Clostridium zeae]|uniref:Glycosyl hydrolase family 88 n=1 Tax=Clostridium zeae TaxID=2759022 RepID=A0ABQ1E5U6_9CLOT|nr:glycoside hydrolase family 88 protein [Clostridium zeae]GFZ30066.1 glycosyl hydrolase family 88 [Clostridium zeae]